MRFRNEYFFLSNFYPASVFGYPTAEHCFVAAKTLDLALREKVRACKTPAEAKRLGRTLPLRPEWSKPEFRVAMMETIVRRKFNVHPKLAAMLVATGDEELVEDNWWGDTFWGRHEGVGENHLGKLLMLVRSELATEKSV